MLQLLIRDELTLIKQQNNMQYIHTSLPWAIARLAEGRRSKAGGKQSTELTNSLCAVSDHVQANSRARQDCPLSKGSRLLQQGSDKEITQVEGGTYLKKASKGCAFKEFLQKQEVNPKGILR